MFLSIPTGPGVYYGNFDFTSKSKDNLTKESRLLPYPLSDSEAAQNPRPLAIVVTEFHVLLLFQDRYVNKAECF